ncbi:hypothetical protein D9M73_141450 [compost metagenome]
MSIAATIDQTEGIDAVVGRVGETVRSLVILHPLAKRGAFRVLGEKPLHLGRIGLAGGRVGGHGQHLFIETLGRVHRQHRWGVHAAAPALAVIAGEFHRQAAGGHAGIGAEWVGATNGETAHHGHACLAEHPGTGQGLYQPAAGEVTAHAQAFGMVFPIAGVMPGLGLESVDNAFRRQACRPEPAGGIGKGGGQRGNPCAYGSQAQGAGATL